MLPTGLKPPENADFAVPPPPTGLQRMSYFRCIAPITVKSSE